MKEATAHQQVKGIAEIIQACESKCEFLEMRNAKLTAQMLQRQRALVERSFGKRGKAAIEDTFRAWHRGVRFIIMENSLEDANRNLQESQAIAQELGSQLAREREAQQEASQTSEQTIKRKDQLIAEGVQIREQAETNAKRLRMLELQLQSVEQALYSSRRDGHGIAETIDAFVRGSRNNKIETQEEANAVDEGARLVNEVDGVMQQLHSVLKPNKSAEASPNTVPRAMRRSGA